MSETWVDQKILKENLASFFQTQKRSLGMFGNTVNQTFEAFVFAATATWYRENKWDVTFMHPKDFKGKPQPLRLKFSTRGRPENYSFVECKKSGLTRHIRHQMRVATKSHNPNQRPRANVCLDVAVIDATDVSWFRRTIILKTSA